MCLDERFKDWLPYQQWDLFLFTEEGDVISPDPFPN